MSCLILVTSEDGLKYILSDNKDIRIKLIGQECNEQDMCIQKYSVCLHKICICPESFITVNNKCKELKIIKSGDQDMMKMLLILGGISGMVCLVILTIIMLKHKFYKSNSEIDIEMAFYCKNLNLDAEIWMILIDL